MAENSGNGAPRGSGRSRAPGPGADRQERLSQALRENLRKRKAQQRGRRDSTPADEAPGETARGTAEEGEPDGR
ncbi:hypothetical protein [Pelagibius sp.]|uniref:hypothetical protein n=1 Tax=Pelagibius sp. TaxID=1931238 RepID=UPI003B504C91